MPRMGDGQQSRAGGPDGPGRPGTPMAGGAGLGSVGAHAAGPAGGELAGPAAALATDSVHYGVMVRPDGLPAASYLIGFYNSGTIVMVARIGFVMLLTPPGRCRPRAGAGGPGSWWPPR